MRDREDERRRRDPTFRPDAIDLSTANIKPYDKWIDYYARLEVAEFASSLELKKAHMRLALVLHPDKQPAGTTEEQVEAAKVKFHEMIEAFEILSEPATRREYDAARDNLDANNEAGIANSIGDTKPPPTCIDFEVTLEQLYHGTRKEVTFIRNTFANTRWHKTESGGMRTLKVNRGEAEGTTFWYRGEGDSGPLGKADLVFCLKQTPHDTFER